jgi:hypothetical protein
MSIFRYGNFCGEMLKLTLERTPNFIANSDCHAMLRSMPQDWVGSPILQICSLQFFMRDFPWWLYTTIISTHTDRSTTKLHRKGEEPTVKGAYTNTRKNYIITHKMPMPQEMLRK